MSFSPVPVYNSSVPGRDLVSAFRYASAMNAQDLDPTFRKYTSEEASAYSAGRSSPYSASLYEQIIHYHASNGNANDFKTLLDIGCGPGSVTRALAPYFDHATGMDPGGEMIAVASANGGYTKIGEGIEFEVIGAEQLSTAKSVQTGEVDMLTAGMAVSNDDYILDPKLMSMFLGSLVQHGRILGPSNLDVETRRDCGIMDDIVTLLP